MNDSLKDITILFTNNYRKLKYQRLNKNLTGENRISIIIIISIFEIFCGIKNVYIES